MDECKRLVSAVSFKWKSRDKQSAIMFITPAICSGNNDASSSIINVARYLATTSSIGFLTGLNVEWCSQPIVDELSEKARM